MSAYSLSLATILLFTGQASDAEDVTSHNAIERLREVESYYDGLEVVWHERVVSAAEDNESDAQKPGLSEESIRKRMLFKRDMIRYQTVSQSADDQGKQFEYVLGAKRLVMLSPFGSPGQGHPSAIVHPRDAAIGQNMNCTPAVLCFRPLYHRFGGIDSTVSVQRNAQNHLELRCAGDNMCESVFVLSPTGQVWKCQIFHRGRLFQEIAIAYADSEARVRPPVSWRLSTLSPTGSVLQSLVATVEDIKLMPNLDDKDFEVSFGPGTRVTDRLNNRKYLVQADNAERAVLPSEIALPHNVLMSTESGKVNKPSAWIRWIIGSTMVFAVLVVAYLIWRRQAGSRN